MMSNKSTTTAARIHSGQDALNDPDVKLFLYYVNSPKHRAALLERLQDLGELAAFLRIESGTN